MSRASPRRIAGRLIGALAFLALVVLAVMLWMMMQQAPDREEEHLEQAKALGYEPRDLPVRGILVFGVVLIVVGGIALLVVTGLQFTLMGSLPRAPFPPTDLQNAPAPTLPPEPRLMAVPGQDLRELRAQEEEMLRTYGWINRESGIVRIPIERAMEILAGRGLPTRPAGEADFEDDGRQIPSDASSGRKMESYP